MQRGKYNYVCTAFRFRLTQAKLILMYCVDVSCRDTDARRSQRWHLHTLQELHTRLPASCFTRQGFGPSILQAPLTETMASHEQWLDSDEVRCVMTKHIQSCTSKHCFVCKSASPSRKTARVQGAHRELPAALLQTQLQSWHTDSQWHQQAYSGQVIALTHCHPS